jgi:hypothetical protein
MNDTPPHVIPGEVVSQQPSTQLATVQPQAATASRPAPPNFTLDELMGMAKVVADSKLFGNRTQPEAMVLLLMAQAEGIHPIQAQMYYHVIHGRPAMKSEIMLSRFQDAGGMVRWITRSDDLVSAEFTYRGQSAIVTWDTERVIKAGLNKENHLKYPQQMKTARVITEGVRLMNPSVLSGLPSVEEAYELAEAQPTQAEAPKRITQTNAPLSIAAAKPRTMIDTLLGITEKTAANQRPPHWKNFLGGVATAAGMNIKDKNNTAVIAYINDMPEDEAVHAALTEAYANHLTNNEAPWTPEMVGMFLARFDPDPVTPDAPIEVTGTPGDQGDFFAESSPTSPETKATHDTLPNGEKVYG